MFFLVVVTPGIIVIPVIKELSEHLLNIVQSFLLSFGSLLLSFQTSTKVVIPLSAIFTDALFVRTELTVAEEAYPLSLSSSSDDWTDLLLGSGEATAVEEEGCS